MSSLVSSDGAGKAHDNGPLSLPKTSPSQPTIANVAKRSIPTHTPPVSRAEKKNKLEPLSNTPNSRYSPELMAKRLVQKYKDPLLVLEMLNQLTTKHGGDARFNGTLNGFTVDLEALATLKTSVQNYLLTGKTNQAAVKSMYLAQTGSQPATDEKRQKLVSEIATQIVGCILIRPETSIQLKTGGTLTQTHGHVSQDENGLPQFIKHKSISAEIQKKEPNVGEIANHGIIKFENGGESEIVLSRSSRTDTPEKIQDKSRADILARLNTTSKKGLTQIADNLCTYQRTDVTLMDTNLLKATATAAKTTLGSLVSQVKGKGEKTIEDERAFVAAKRESSAKLFKKAPYLEHRFSIDGKVVTVREMRPLIFNFVFSGQAKDEKNIREAREQNVLPCLVLFNKLLKEKSPRLDSYKLLFENATHPEEVLATHKNELIGRLTTDLLQKTFSNEPEMHLALKGMLVTLTGKDEKGANYDTEHASDAQFLLLYNLSQVANSPISVECKSGNDRTATATALICAQKEYRAINGKPYDPLPFVPGVARRLHSEREEFGALFSKYILAFAKPNLLASRGADERGNPDIKTRKSPPFLNNIQQQAIENKLNVV